MSGFGICLVRRPSERHIVFAEGIMSAKHVLADIADRLIYFKRTIKDRPAAVVAP